VYPGEFIERTAINAKADGAFAVNVYVRNIAAANTVTAQIRTLDGASVGQPFSQSVSAGDAMVTLAPGSPTRRPGPRKPESSIRSKSG